MKVFLKKRVFTNQRNFAVAIIFSICLLVIGVKAVKAFYNKTSEPTQLVRSVVGNFFIGDTDDVVIEIFRETGYNNEIYVNSYYVPSSTAYEFSNVTCNIQSCETNNEQSNCYYKYDSRKSQITVVSERKIDCKFYFDKKGESDITVYIMKEDLNTQTNPKTYEISNDIPSYGYRFSNISCDNNVEATYDACQRKFIFTTSNKTTCYAYFDSIGLNNADINANIYVQTEINSDTYEEVEFIPSNIEYQISTNPNFVSSCMTMTTPSVPSVTPFIDEQGYLVINAVERVNCTVYLDIVE